MKKSLSLLLLASLCASVFAQENLTYQKPPQSILALADFQRAPAVVMDSKKTVMLLSFRDTYKTLTDLSQTELRLAGLRINPTTNIASATNYINNLKIRKTSDSVDTQVKGLPNGALITHLQWSPNEKKIAFTNTGAKGVELWVIDVDSASAKKLSDGNLNANLGMPYTWFKDSDNLLVKVLPKNRPALLDASKNLPTGAIISNADGTVSTNRTFPDLLKNKNDEANFENLATSELLKVNLSAKSSVFKKSDMFEEISFSPDGKYLLINTLQKPFSYIVPLDRFPSKTVVTDLAGKLIKVVNETPLIEIMPKGFSATQKGKRDLIWRADKAASLVYVFALDEGDPAKKVDFRDEIFQWNAPFDQAATSLLKTTQRFSSIVWGSDTLAIAYDAWYDTRNIKTYFFNPSNSSEAPRVVSERNMQDVYADPGRFEMKHNQYHRNVLAIENNKAFLIGEGHSKKGQFPFIDEMDLSSLQKHRLF